jgi:hypothetical protein
MLVNTTVARASSEMSHKRQEDVARLAYDDMMMVRTGT